MAARDLTPKQQVFVEEYLVDMNATQAALRAGYSKKTAYRTGADNLRKPQIADAIAKAQAERSERTQVTQDMVIAELAKIGFSDLREVVTGSGSLVSVQDWGDNIAGAISSVEVVQRPSGEFDDDGNVIYENIHKLKVWDKVSALEKIGKHLGMFVDRSEVTSFVVNLEGDDASL